MTEEKIAYLLQASASLDSHKHAVLKSHYSMKCYEITRGYGLPPKEFSSEKRCSNCFLPWSTGMYETKVTPIKNTKKRRKKTKSSNVMDNNKTHCTQLERTCSFCKKITMIKCTKPPRTKDATKQCAEIEEEKDESKETSKNKKKSNKTKKPMNIYTNTSDIFSLSNQKNNLSSGKVTKVIKNNKKKKDKFAGLCQAAVLASAKLKEKKDQSTTNKLHLFLKPSQ